MKGNSTNISFEEYLRQHTELILRTWLDRLTMEEQFLLFQMAGSTEVAIVEYLTEILAHLEERHATIPDLPHEFLSLSAAQQEIAILLAGREVFKGLLSDFCPQKNELWLETWTRLQQVFHTIIRENSRSACDYCRDVLDAEMSELKDVQAEAATTSLSPKRNGRCTACSIYDPNK
jgi:hypothetical protein